MNYKHRKPRPSAACHLCKSYKYAGNSRERRSAQYLREISKSREETTRFLTAQADIWNSLVEHRDSLIRLKGEENAQP